ncbi:WW domain-containing protein [Sphaceloma murrayae]|uniref:WW domain-containing protein n=1 Tax=Sphaceloma murrayae TaxID=2082308 RepID=A0A2K1R1N7_9PEZI|nr:WW domain-containing protein [Sphaceloma murrayae]
MSDDSSTKGASHASCSTDHATEAPSAAAQNSHLKSPAQSPGADKRSVRGRSPSEEGEERDDDPPLPDEEPPPLPDEVLPAQEPSSDGWEARWDNVNTQWYYFNRFTGVSQWENPRVPEASASTMPPYSAPPGVAPGTIGAAQASVTGPPPDYRGYNPKIHGDFDPNADYAKYHQVSKDSIEGTGEAPSAAELGELYEQSATFNRFTGKFQAEDKGPDAHNDENKSRRQMEAFFDVDKAANAHGGQSLKAQRQRQKLSKRQIQEYNDKKKAKKIKKDRDWLTS